MEDSDSSDIVDVTPEKECFNRTIINPFGNLTKLHKTINHEMKKMNIVKESLETVSENNKMLEADNSTSSKDDESYGEIESLVQKRDKSQRNGPLHSNEKIKSPSSANSEVVKSLKEHNFSEKQKYREVKKIVFSSESSDDSQSQEEKNDDKNKSESPEDGSEEEDSDEGKNSQVIKQADQKDKYRKIIRKILSDSDSSDEGKENPPRPSPQTTEYRDNQKKILSDSESSDETEKEDTDEDESFQIIKQTHQKDKYRKVSRKVLSDSDSADSETIEGLSTSHASLEESLSSKLDINNSMKNSYKTKLSGIIEQKTDGSTNASTKTTSEMGTKSIKNSSRTKSLGATKNKTDDNNASINISSELGTVSKKNSSRTESPDVTRKKAENSNASIKATSITSVSEDSDNVSATENRPNISTEEAASINVVGNSPSVQIIDEETIILDTPRYQPKKVSVYICVRVSKMYKIKRNML